MDSGQQTDNVNYGRRRPIYRLGKKGIWILVALCVVILIVIVIVTGVKHNKKTVVQPSYNQELQSDNAVDKLISEDKFAQAETLLKNEPTSATTQTTLTEIASLQQAQHDYSGAITTLQGIQKKFGFDYAIGLQLGQIEATLGNSKLAIGYYQQAEQSLQSNPSQMSDPSGAMADLQARITELQGSSS